MRARVFTVRLNPETREFDDRALSSFLETHPALSVFGYLVSIDGEPALAVLITHRGSDRPSVVPPRDRPPERPSAGQRSPPLVLADPDRALFETLRSWRNDRARREGRPAYILCTNAQLAQIATLRPTTMAGIKEIPGIGDSRVEALGADLLALVRTALPASAARSEPSDG